MTKIELTEDIIEESFQETIRYVTQYPILSFENMGGNYNSFTVLKVEPNDEDRLMTSYSGRMSGLFTHKTIVQDSKVEFKLSTYSGERTIEQFREQLSKIEYALNVIKGLEIIYNKEREQLKHYLETGERNGKEQQDARERELKVSYTKGKTSTFGNNTAQVKKTFNQFLKLYYNQIRDSRKKLGEGRYSEFFNNNIKTGKDVYVAGDSAVYLLGKSEYGLKFNHYGIDVCDKFGRGIREGYRKGVHNFEDINKLVNSVYTKDNIADKAALAGMLKRVYNGKIDRELKESIRNSVRK